MEKLMVCKFGGSSLADAKQFQKVKDIVLSDPLRKVIVVSAAGKRNSSDHKVTDLLYMCYQLASHHLSFTEVFSMVRERIMDIKKGLELEVDIEKELDEVERAISNGCSRDFAASRGEYLNALLMADYLQGTFLDAKDLICFDDEGALEEEKTREAIQKHVQGDLMIIPGFYGSKPDGEILTFSRGGSDITGSLISAALEAKVYENWTDVSGFLVADPKIVESSMPMRIISYQELRELSYMGAQVLHEEAIFPLRKKGLPVHIRNTNHVSDPGTYIVPDISEDQNLHPVTGISGKKDFLVLRVEKTMMNEEMGFFRRLISVFESNDIQIEHMPSSIDSISIIVSENAMKGKEKKVISEIEIYCNPDDIVLSKNMALITVVGRGMIRRKGMAAKLFKALSHHQVNVRMINQGSSEINIIVGVENSDFEKAIRAIYQEFFEGEES